MNWETILAVITHPAVVTVVFAIAGLAIKGFVKYKKLISAVIAVVRGVIAAHDPDSPGGKHFTEAELIEIGQKVVTIVQEVDPLIKKAR